MVAVIGRSTMCVHSEMRAARQTRKPGKEWREARAPRQSLETSGSADELVETFTIDGYNHGMSESKWRAELVELPEPDSRPTTGH